MKNTITKLFALTALLFSLSIQTHAQVTTNSGSGLAASYPTMAAAITALNAASITSPVIITETANETAPLGGYSITASGTATNTITLTGGGFTITAFTPQTGGNINDAIFKIIGGDYITIQGFTLQENPANANTVAASNNMTEFGIAIFYATTTDGAKNVTIQNNTISLNKTYQNTFGIYANSRTSATAMTTAADITSSAGANDNLHIYSNSISNVNQGICVVGSTATANMATGLQIGGSAGNANTITNWGTTGTFSGYISVSGTLNCIFINNNINYDISYNTITSATGVNPGSVFRAILADITGTAPTAVINNTISNNNVALSMAGTNNVQGINNGASGTATNLSLNNNTVSLAFTAATTGTSQAIINNPASLNTVAITGNTISASFPTGVMSGTLNGINNNTTITNTATAAINISNNTFQNIVFTSAASAGITLIGTNSTGSTNINSNNFNNLTLNTTGSVTFISKNVTHAANAVVNVNNNLITTGFSKTGAGGTVQAYLSNGSSPATVTETNNGNNFSNITLTGATTLTLWQSSDGGTPIKSVTNNTFTNITGGSSAMVILNVGFSGPGTISGNAINTITGSGAITGFLSTGGSGTQNILSNDIHGITSSGASAVLGISITGGTTQNVSRNKIYDINTTNAGGNATGISITGGTTVSAYNNLIGDLKGALATGANAITGITIGAATTANLYYNTVYLNATGGATFGSSALYVSSTTPTVTSNNNIFINNSVPGSTSGYTAAFRYSSVPGVKYATTSNRNLFYAGTPAANRLIYGEAVAASATNAQQTLANYQTYIGGVKDANSITQDLSAAFVSTAGSSASFLKPSPSTVTLAESGGSAISGITDDYAGLTRPVTPGTAPDMGAWEFAGVSPAPVITLNTDATAGCTATSHTVSLNVSTPTGTITGVTLSYAGGVSGSTAMSLTSGTAASGVWSGTIPAGTPGASVSWSATATNSSSLTTNYTGSSYTDAPLATYSIVAAASPSPICAGASSNLSVTVTKPGTATIGTSSNITTLTQELTAFCNRRASYKMQMLFTASELTAAGYGPGTISAMTFTIGANGDATTNTAFVVKVGTTGLAALTDYVASGGFITVFPSATYTHSVGVNTITFSTPFVWDGTSNIVVEVSHNGIDAINNATTFYTNTVSNTVAYNYNGTTPALLSNSRPNVTFSGTIAATPTAYSWSDGASTVGTTNPLSVTPASTTAYTATITALGCNATSNTVTVNVNARPTATISGSPTICSGSSTNLTIVVTGTGTKSGTLSPGAIPFSGAGPNITVSVAPTSTTTYTVATLSDANCTATGADLTGSATVTVNTLSTAPTGATGTTTICNGGSTTLTVSGGTAGTGAVARWYTGSCGTGLLAGSGSSITVAPSTTTTYFVRYEGTCNNSSCGTVTVTVNARPTAALSGSATICGGGSTNLSVAVTGTGTISGTLNPGAIAFSGTAPAITIPVAPSSTTTYTLATLSDANCTSIAGDLSGSAIVTVTTPASGTFSYTGSPYCSNDGTASVTSSSLTSGGTYTGDAGLVITASGDVNLASSTPGTHTVTYTIAAGTCPAYTTTASITINTAPSSTISYTSPACSDGGTATPGLTGTTGGTYSGDAGLVITSAGAINLSASTAGTHTVTYTMTAPSGCTGPYTATTTITINTAPAATISYVSPACSDGGTATPGLTGTTGGTYSGDAGLVITSAGAINLAASTAGTHTVTYTMTGAAGCTGPYIATASIAINAAPSGTFSYAASPYCTSGTTASVTGSGLTSGGSYSSTGGLSINSSTGDVALGASTAGTYTVTYTVAASGGCASYSTTASITINTAPTATIAYTGSPYCATAGSVSVTMTGTTGGVYSSAAGLSLNSSTGAVDAGLSTAGTYTVTYTVAATGGCAAFSTTASITINTAPTATIAYGGSPYCATAGSVSVTQTGTTGGTYSSAAGLSINSATGAVDAGTSTAGTYTVTYTIAAGGGCAAYSTTASITINAAPSATIAYAGTPYCATAGTVSVTMTGTTGGVYSSAAGLSINGSTGAVDAGASSAGTYTVTYTVAASGGCAAYSTTASITINTAPSGTFSYAASPYCTSGTTASVTGSGLTSGGSYSSTGGLSINSSTGDVALGASTAGTYTVTYTVAASGGCASYSTTASITINTAPTATIAYAGAPYCATAGTVSVTMTGTTGGVYSSAAGLSINASTGAVNTTTSTAGTYTVNYDIAASGGCAAVNANTTITINAAPSATIAYSGTPYCATGATATVTLTGTAGGTYSATPSGLSINASTGDVDPALSTPGTYTVTYTVAAGGGCALFTTSTSITIDAAPVASISYSGSPYYAGSYVGSDGSDYSCSGTASVSMSGPSGGTYSASPGGISIDASTGAVHLGSSSPGTYTVTYAIAAGACAATSATATITLVAPAIPVVTYASSPYCTSGGTASPTVVNAGFDGSFYTYPSMGIDNSTGNIDLAATGAGSYQVSYYTNTADYSCIMDAAPVSITINAAPTATINYGGSPYCATGSTATVTLTGSSGGTYSALPSGLSINSSTGDVDPALSTTGTYTVNYNIAAGGGCAAFTTSTSITIDAAPTATISYSGSPYCTSAGTVSVTMTGTTGGTYSSAAGLSIDALTGAVDVALSTPGTYTVNYDIAAGGGCAAVNANTSITINAAPTATIAYSGTPYCTSAGTVSVTMTGSTGGTYSSAAGLSIDASTGAVNTTASTPGTYTVNYDIAASGGCAAVNANTSITINAAPTATISYNGSPYCPSGMASVTLTGTSGGTYSGDAGLVINASGGDVDLSASTGGTHTVTYTIAAGGGCSGTSTTASLSINANGQWLGNTSDWNNSSNWCGGVPTASSNVMIPATANDPVVLSGSASVNNITLMGTSLTVDPGVTMNLYGNVSLSPSGAFSAAGGTVNFAGSGAQNILPGFTVGNLQVNGGSNKTLNSDVTVTNNLDLVSGYVILGTNDLLMGVGASITGGSALSYVMTNGAGSELVQQINAGTGDVMFPVGNADYNPATISNTGISDNYGVHVRDEVLDAGASGTQVNPATTYVINHTWDIVEGLIGGSDACVTLQWNAGEENNPSFDYNHTYVSHYYAGTWHHDGYAYAIDAPPATGSNPYTATLCAVSSFSPFTIGSAGGATPLPVHLTDVSATNEGSRNRIEWHSAQEAGLDHYEVERSIDGNSFSHMTDVAATGYAFGYLTYDNQPNEGLTYYRVRMVNTDGTSLTSNIVHAFMKVGDNETVAVYPNPVTDVLHVEVYGATDKATIMLTDLSGKVISPLTLNNGKAEISTANLASGIYFVKFTDGAISQTIRVNKQ